MFYNKKGYTFPVSNVFHINTSYIKIKTMAIKTDKVGIIFVPLLMNTTKHE